MFSWVSPSNNDRCASGIVGHNCFNLFHDHLCTACRIYSSEYTRPGKAIYICMSSAFHDKVMAYQCHLRPQTNALFASRVRHWSGIAACFISLWLLKPKTCLLDCRVSRASEKRCRNCPRVVKRTPSTRRHKRLSSRSGFFFRILLVSDGLLLWPIWLC